MARLWLFPTDTPWPWPTPARRQTQGEGNHPPLQSSEAERRGRSAAEVCTSAARKTAGYPCVRQEQGSSGRLGLPCFRRNGAGDISGSRCGRNEVVTKLVEPSIPQRLLTR